MKNPSPRDPEALVAQFHETYNMPISTAEPSVDFQRVHMRISLIMEEVSELVTAVYGACAGEAIQEAAAKLRELDEGRRDVVEAADALADLTYVVYGMALESGISLPAVLEQVQASNMSKLGADGKPIYREDGKVLKGPNFFQPDIARALKQRISVEKHS
ncbi:MAG: nucleoside triphosphate pyrophosphohydrolase family protein [Varibaculum sp.]|nr:nucleoside triphosphate pyrophosphohydrolase family protein [Varibaculum sp.]